MLWFQGAIPAAIASAKRSGAVFVVFVAGEGGGRRNGAGHLSGLLPTPGLTASALGLPDPRSPALPRPFGAQRAWPPPPWREAPSQPRLPALSPSTPLGPRRECARAAQPVAHRPASRPPPAGPAPQAPPTPSTLSGLSVPEDPLGCLHARM